MRPDQFNTACFIPNDVTADLVHRDICDFSVNAMAIVLRGLDAVLLYALMLPPLTGRTGRNTFTEGLRKAAGLTHLSSFVLVGVHECLVPVPVLIPFVLCLLCCLQLSLKQNREGSPISIPIGT